MFEASKRILLRLSKARKRAYPTIARVIPQSYVIRTSVYCTVCTSTQVIDRKVMQRIAPIQRSGRGSTVGAQSAQRAPLRPLCACVLTASPGFAMAERQHTIRPTSAQPSGSPASADAAGKPATRRARPLPRALATHHACDASLPRSRRDAGRLARRQTACVALMHTTETTDEVCTAATAAAETWNLRTATSTRSCQGARYTGHARGRPR